MKKSKCCNSKIISIGGCKKPERTKCKPGCTSVHTWHYECNNCKKPCNIIEKLQLQEEKSSMYEKSSIYKIIN